MDDEERQRIFDEAFATIERADAATSDLSERRAANLGRVDHVDERERFERRRAARPPKPEPKLDIDLSALIDQRVEEALSIERATMIEMMKGVTEALDDCGEKLARFEARIVELEVRAIGPDVAEQLGNDARKLKGEIATLQHCIEDLRGTVAAEAQRGSYSPTYRYPRDLN